jgi:hypothetical protein
MVDDHSAYLFVKKRKKEIREKTKKPQQGRGRNKHAKKRKESDMIG